MELVNNVIHHDKAHMGEKPHECNKCDKTFKKKLLLIMTRLTWEINHMSVTNVTRHNDERLLRMF